MIMLLIYWVYVSAILFLYGVLFEEIITKLFAFKVPTKQHLVYTIISGLVCLTILGTWFSIFYRLNIEFNILILSGGVIVCFLFKKQIFERLRTIKSEIRKTPLSIKFIFVCTIFIANSGSCVDSIWNFDSGMYYVQYVKWIENYAVIPGLGNLRPHFAYNSTWHILTAIFSFSFLDSDIKFNDLNGLFWVFMVSRSLYSLNQILRKKAVFSDYFSVFMPLHIYVMRYYFNAAFADFTIICLIFLILTLLIEIIETQNWGQVSLQNVLLGIFSFFTVTIKLSSAPIMLPTIILIIMMLRQKYFVTVLKSAGIILLFVTPWLLRYYYMSGYLFFPLHQIDLFSPDWKMDAGASYYLQTEIEARSKIERFDYDITQVVTFSYSRWIPEWFETMKSYNQYIIVFLGIVTSIFTPIYLYNLLKKYKNILFPLVFFTLILGLCFWFFKAPSPRFGYAWIFSIAFFINAFCLQFIHQKIKNLKYIILIVMVLWGIKVSYDNLNDLYCFAGDCFYLEEQLQIPSESAHHEVVNIIFGKTPKTRTIEVISYQLDGVTFYQPKNRDYYHKSLCWDAPLPCYSYNVSENITLRGKTLQEGFRLRKK